MKLDGRRWRRLAARLIRRQTTDPQPASFAASWYLRQYPDVMAAGMDPWEHFNRYGRYEGRFAKPQHAAIWELDELPVDLLEELEFDIETSPSAAANYAAWLLGRWYASRARWRETATVLSAYQWNGLTARSPEVTAHRMPMILSVEALRLDGQTHAASERLRIWQSCEADHGLSCSVESILAEANLRHPEDAGPNTFNTDQWFSLVNRLFEAGGLARLTGSRPLALDQLCAATCPEPPPVRQRECVSVIVPARNAQEVLRTSVSSLLAQTWKDVEVIIVDDASDDATLRIAESLAAGDSRVRVAHQPENLGAYAARNRGLSLATGDFITVQDSDDWSHPQKIERQVLALRHSPSHVASISEWVRVSSSLHFGGWASPAGWAGWCHRNTSSLMVRREVTETLGYWDRVRCNADTEYVCRLLRAYGEDSIVEVNRGVPLSFGRLGNGSLTQRKRTHIFSIFSGVRRAYEDAFRAWHASAQEVSTLYLPEYPAERPFPAPEAFCR